MYIDNPNFPTRLANRSRKLSPDGPNLARRRASFHASPTLLNASVAINHESSDGGDSDGAPTNSGEPWLTFDRSDNRPLPGSLQTSA